ncbi:MAG TPA: carboxypeptidase-like regulatory domain-containing protein, partial [Bacteroidales bacterium]|nr:carboxypeptidase-like regulatory domain-containing protein [Bacteroidales bacterium]
MIRNTLILFSVIIVAALTPAYNFAQGYSIKGEVTDRSTNETIPGVTVSIEESSAATVTDANGVFELTAADEKVNLLFKHISYKP